MGEYHVLSLQADCPVAVTTLASVELADQIRDSRPPGLSIVGKAETENIGIEKIIRNILAVPTIRYLILCGRESDGHYSGHTLSCLLLNGVDDRMRVIGSKGQKPVLTNVAMDEVNTFRAQITLIDLIGCTDQEVILDKLRDVTALHFAGSAADSQSVSPEITRTEPNSAVKAAGSTWPVVEAVEKDPHRVKLDPAGYFVIVPKPQIGQILVEHYANSNAFLRMIQGDTARDIYWTIIDQGWVTELSHAAYLGKELTRAELSIQQGTHYVQDKA